MPVVAFAAAAAATAAAKDDVIVQLLYTDVLRWFRPQLDLGLSANILVGYIVIQSSYGELQLESQSSQWSLPPTLGAATKAKKTSSG